MRRRDIASKNQNSPPPESPVASSAPSPKEQIRRLVPAGEKVEDIQAKVRLSEHGEATLVAVGFGLEQELASSRNASPLIGHCRVDSQARPFTRSTSPRRFCVIRSPRNVRSFPGAVSFSSLAASSSVILPFLVSTSIPGLGNKGPDCHITGRGTRMALHCRAAALRTRIRPPLHEHRSPLVLGTRRTRRHLGTRQSRQSDRCL
jgi:hypothetical protein